MKILYFIVSLNLAAGSTLVSQLASYAENEAGSDTADWLKSSIGSLETRDSHAQSPKTKLVGQKARAEKLVNDSDTKSIVLSTARGKIKLMPFMPNRKLPSKSELEAQLLPQLPRLAPENNRPLEGKVSLNSAVSQVNSNNSQVNSLANAKSNSKKNWSNIVAATKAAYSAAKSPATGFPFLKEAEHALIERTQQRTNTQPADLPIVSLKPAADLDKEMADEYAQMQLELPSAQRNRGNQTIAAKTSTIMNDQIASQSATNGSAGPPPFPLSLLPQASLKQLVRGVGSRPKCNAPAVYFGCWHNKSGLPSAGFYHYARSGKARYRSTSSKIAVRPTTGLIRRIGQPQTFNRNTLIARGFAQPRMVKVAAYPAYPVNTQYGLY